MVGLGGNGNDKLQQNRHEGVDEQGRLGRENSPVVSGGT